MTNKTKNIVLLIGFALALLICYKLAIKETLDLKEQHTSLKQEAFLFKNTPKQLSLLKQKEIYYDSILGKYELQGNSIQNNLLKTINSVAEKSNLKVVNFLEPHNLKDNDLIIKTYEFTLEGDYNSIIELIHKLEQQTKLGEVIHLHFEKKKNFRTGKYYLEANVLLQSFG